MRSWLVLAVLAVLLAVPAATAVTYPQAGYDAGRTGAVPFELPRTNATAFETQLPGTPTGTVAIDGRTAYIVTLDHGIEIENETLDENALWSIDLDTAEVAKRFTIFDERPDWSAAFTDGERVYTQVERTVTAYGLDGEELWTWTVPNRLPQAAHVTCFDDPAVHQGTIYLACLELRERHVQTPTGGEQELEEIPHTTLVVAALDVDDGEERWRWFSSADEDPENCTIGSLNCGEEQVPSERWDTVNAEVTVTDAKVFVYGYVIGRGRAYTNDDGGLGNERYERWFAVWGLDTETGRYELHSQGPATTFQRQNVGGGYNMNTYDEVALGGKVAARPSLALLETGIGEGGSSGMVQAFNPSDGSSLWNHELNTAEAIKRIGGHSLGTGEERTIAAAPRSLAAFTEDGEREWQTQLNPAGMLTYGTAPIAIGPNTAVAETLWHEEGDFDVATLDRSGYGLQALDAETGHVLWHEGFFSDVGPPGDRFTAAPPFEDQWLHDSTPGFGPGLIVAANPAGHVDVLGTTAVSMSGPEVDTERFPAVGETITLDLSETEPTAFGPATRYRVQWGDGTATPWQADPVFTHAYQEAGEVTARLFVGNAANQTATTDVVMRVGESEPNFIETAFQQENQDLTFGVLGLAVALTGGAIGVGRRYRERSRLQEELDALEQLFEETRDTPAECEAQLTERKAHARGLLTDGRLTEEQFSVLERRIEELKRGLRLTAVEDDFAFLPYSLVVGLREMLEDGRVTAMEKAGFLQALEEDEMVHPDHKAVVRQRIETWFARDAGGGRP